MTKIIKYLFQAIFLYSFFFLGRLFGLEISRKLFSIIFSKIAPFFKSKKIIKNNLDIFAHTNHKINKEKIIKNMWKNYGMTFIEYIFLDYFKKNNSHIVLKGEDNLIKIRQKEKSVIFISGHFANFELMSMEITKKNIPLATIYRPLNNIFINPFMEYLRRKYICKNQIKKGIHGVKDAIKFIKKNHSIALMIDQRVSEGERVNLFDKPALTTTLPAQLSAKFNLDIVPVYIERNENNNFIIEFQKEINFKDFNNKLQLTEKLNEILEEMIKRNPNQWIWTHNRWK
jgi:Kdo2-lipid IVA lauroyltransferase/acyltransferase